METGALGEALLLLLFAAATTWEGASTAAGAATVVTLDCALVMAVIGAAAVVGAS